MTQTDKMLSRKEGRVVTRVPTATGALHAPRNDVSLFT
jgi:hypothetical protein